MEDNKRIIEINGVKLEVDLRDAKVIDNYKIGDTIKVLRKEYGDTFKSHLGVIVGFDAFEQHPTIVVAYLDIGYDEVKIRFVYINSTTKDVEITKINDWDVPFSKQSIIDKMDAGIAKKEEEARNILSKKQAFLGMFGTYFEGKVNIN